jgi:hypothetical protein
MLAVLFAFLAGGGTLNVIKEELPSEQESLFWAFVLGAALYTALLLAPVKPGGRVGRGRHP